MRTPRLDLQVNAHWGGSQSQGQSLSSASSQFSKAGEPDRKHQFPPSCFPPGALGHKQSSPTLRPPELTAAEQSAGDKNGPAQPWAGWARTPVGHHVPWCSCSCSAQVSTAPFSGQSAAHKPSQETAALASLFSFLESRKMVGWGDDGHNIGDGGDCYGRGSGGGGGGDGI